MPRPGRGRSSAHRAVTRLAGQRRAHLDLVDSRAPRSIASTGVFAEQSCRPPASPASRGTTSARPRRGRGCGRAALDDFAALDQAPSLPSPLVVPQSSDDHQVLRHVDEAAGQVARVRGLERRVGEALRRAVRRDEVLQDVQASRKFAVIGVSMISPSGFAIRPRMPASWRICAAEPRAPGVRHHEDRLNDSCLTACLRGR